MPSSRALRKNSIQSIRSVCKLIPRCFFSVRDKENFFILRDLVRGTLNTFLKIVVLSCRSFRRCYLYGFKALKALNVDFRSIFAVQKLSSSVTLACRSYRNVYIIPPGKRLLYASLYQLIWERITKTTPQIASQSFDLFSRY